MGVTASEGLPNWEGVGGRANVGAGRGGGGIDARLVGDVGSVSFWAALNLPRRCAVVFVALARGTELADIRLDVKVFALRCIISASPEPCEFDSKLDG